MLEKFTDYIKESEKIVFFGGAGVSTESGLKDYRSTDGIYNTEKEFGVSPEEILSHSFFMKNPEVFYAFYRKYFVSDVAPNGAHKALFELEKMGKLTGVITQNVDSLHQKAGSKTVLELHGNGSKFHCNGCNLSIDNDAALLKIKNGELPRCEKCGFLLKPSVVLYGERLCDETIDKAITLVSDADMLIVGGTSLRVFPASSLVRYFKGKYFVIINKEETSFDNIANLCIRENIGSFLEKAIERIKL